MLLRSLLLVGSMAFSSFADEIALIRVGEPWRYFKGVAEPAVPADAWRRLEFDDSGWIEGDPGIHTAYGNVALDHISIYLRKRFILLHPQQVKWLALRMDYKDGFVAYLNGHEVARRNMDSPPGSQVPYNMSASRFHPLGQTEKLDLSAAAGFLKAGANVLAIQVHNVVQDNLVAFGAVPELMANFNRGPFVQNASTNSIQIIWRTPVETDGAVEFGPTPALGFVVADLKRTTNHLITLAPLAPDSTYYYRVTSTGAERTAVSPVESFRTLSLRGSLSFAVFGDSGAGTAAQHAIAAVLRNAKPDLVLHAGDVIYPSFTHELADERCLSVYGPHMRNVPYYFALGNHDLYSGDRPFLDAFYLPTNNVPIAVHQAAGTSPEHYYSFDHGDAHFVILFVPYLSQYVLRAGDPQHVWLEADLAATRKPWKFLCFHNPVNTSSLHRRDDYNFNGIKDRSEIMETVLPVAQKHGVQLIFSGHDHTFERFNPTNGVHSVVTGGGGVGLYPLDELDAASAQFWVRHNCVKVTVQGDVLRLEALDDTGLVFDWMTICRALPPPTLHQASWHSPLIASKPADDEDGNVHGQSFDFVGTPISTLPGEFSNLGQVYVSNDATNLYVGIEQCLIYPDHHIYLFIESPRQPGVTNLLNVGNGKVDPNGEGADGLDFLANLSFTNFAPTLGCLLGDEFADSQQRSLARSNLVVNPGQGVFRLDAAISDVAHARLQQFNRSPQTGGVFGEQNANFVELAIPYAALGGLQPGETVKIGAVVGGSGFDTNAAAQTRQLDSSFLGYALTKSETGHAVLEGLAVRLAEESDADGDGLLDRWELAHGLNPRSASGSDGADGDPDGDGVTNATEQTAGTDPRDARSALRVNIVSLDGKRHRISWPTVIGKKYEVQVSANPAGGFSNAAPGRFPHKATTESLSYEADAPSAPSVGRFYRVRVVP